MRNIGYVVLILLLSVNSFAQVKEDFNHEDQTVSEGNCWHFNNVTVDKVPGVRSINRGTDFPLGFVNLSGASFTATLTSPTILFDATGEVNFNHKLRAASGTFSNLTVQIVDPHGIVKQTLLNHDYRSGGANSNGDPTSVQAAVLPITYSGYGQVVFSWTSTNTSTEAYIDDIVIDGSDASDPSTNSNGNCAALFTHRDTVCAGEQNVIYNTSYTQSSSTYTWSFTGQSAGTIDDQIVNNDSVVEVDFNTTSGNYILDAVESGTGNRTRWFIHVNSLPALGYAIDSTCLNESYTIDLSLTGTGPWTLEYQYTDSPKQSIVITTTNYSLNMPASADTFEFLSLTDANGCTIQGSQIPSGNVPYFPKPSSLNEITPLGK